MWDKYPELPMVDLIPPNNEDTHSMRVPLIHFDEIVSKHVNKQYM